MSAATAKLSETHTNSESCSVSVRKCRGVFVYGSEGITLLPHCFSRCPKHLRGDNLTRGHATKVPGRSARHFHTVLCQQPGVRRSGRLAVARKQTSPRSMQP